MISHIQDVQEFRHPGVGDVSQMSDSEVLKWMIPQNSPVQALVGDGNHSMGMWQVPNVNNSPMWEVEQFKKEYAANYTLTKL